MSRKNQSKRMMFSNRMRTARMVRRITKANAKTPGFAGVALNLRVGGKWLGAGALFVVKGTEQ